MKFICSSDWHIRKSNPQYRIDNFFDTQCEKIKWMVNYCVDNNICGILHGGDLYDRFDCPYEAVRRYIILFNSYTTPIKMLGCLGQHDMRYHKIGSSNTPAGCLYAGIAGTGSTILEEAPKEYIEPYSKTKIHIYGSSWGEKIPTIQDQSAINILVTHRMVTKSGPLWKDQTDFTEADELLKKTKFRLIVTGDNHNTFSHSYRMRYVVNSGSLMRAKIDQMDHKPTFFVYDTNTNTIEKVEIPILNKRKVFAVEEIKDTKLNDLVLENFVNGLNIDYDRKVSFKENLDSMINETSDINVKSVLEEVRTSL